MALSPLGISHGRIFGGRGPMAPRHAYAGFALAGLAALGAAQAALFADLPLAAPLAALGGYALASAATRGLLPRHFPHHELGWCNVATQVRLALVALIATPLLAGQGAGWTVAALALAVLALDGVDGWLARWQGRASRFGARFDMEVDSALALVLALHALVGGQAGPAVLILGLARYLFVLAAALLPWLGAPLPDRWSRKAVCVAQLSVLIGLQVPAIPAPLAEGATAAVALALAWSFGRDAMWLSHNRTARH